MTLLHLVVSHVYTSAQFGKNHHLDVFVFQKEGPVRTVVLFILDFLYYRIRIYRP